MVARSRQESIDHVTAALRQRVLNQLHLGLVRPGDRLPSVREAGRQLRVDPKIVFVAYRVLHDEGLVVVRPRSGAFVSDRMRFTSRPTTSEWMVEALVQARRRGIAPLEAAELLAKSVTASACRALVVDRNADQLWSIGDELEREYGMTVERLDLDALHRDGHPPVSRVVRDCDLIVTSAFQRHAVRRAFGGVGVPMCAVTMCTDLFEEMGRLLKLRPIYFVLCDPRLAASLRRMFASPDGRKNLRILVHGRDELVVPADAAVYLTRLSRRRLVERGDATGLLARSVPEARVFSDDTARELTRFVINASLLSASDNVPPGRQ